ncbi:MAG TPA: quinate 5-dehydrogenase [Anaerolineae bacterium]|nr:quinate 5-dehydrogenase [Anaerolineae bacterium]
MKRAVSVSLGSSKRDKKVELNLSGEKILIERIGCDGDEKKARRLFAELDGKVEALGVGGVELYVRVADREYPLRAGLWLVQDVKHTPAVDGRGLKHTLERRVMQYAEEHIEEPITPRRAFVTLSVDRFGMAQSIADAGYEMVFGDLMFALGLPIPLKGIDNVRRLARLLLPILGQLPISMLYPTGSKQEEVIPKYERWFQWGQVIAGDFLYIHRHMPDRLEGKVIVTNTTTAENVEELCQRGVKYLVTTTPRFEGRSFGTNMLEAALTAYAGKGRPLSEDELNELLARLDIHPSVQKLN